jgi:rhamnose transport system substrate-binding protein
MARTFVTIGVLACAVLLLAAGCSQRSSEMPKAPGAASGGRKITVALLPKQKGLKYFTSCSQGAEEAAKELGNVEVIYDGPTDGNPATAADMVDRWVQKKVDAIAVSPNNPDVLASAMKKAREKGVHVLTWDADGAPETRELFVNQATAQAIGEALVDVMAKDIGEEGEVAILSASAAAANQNEWIKHMKARLEKYPKIQLVGIKYPGEDQNEGVKLAQGLISDRPNLKGLFGDRKSVV